MTTSLAPRPRSTAPAPAPRPSSTTPAPHASTQPAGPSCVQLPRVFQDPLLEEPPAAGAPAEDRRRYAELVARATAACQRCPLVVACLDRAVVEHDVAGFVGGTTARQRVEIRRRLGVVVPPEDLDTLAGVLGGSRPVDHDEVLRVRAAHPDETLEVLAVRLGCSLSTVKRHLRRERDQPSPPRPVAARPSQQQVLEATLAVTRPVSRGHRDAA
ncbi:Transcription factor WhiB [Friedmanniella luteola]|uniref:Transcription factor WhiB n=1 Tax=Friedmanniella luteola TaxID=546871 RepID=A0A1H1L4L6_9ACTN|nr:WhiB family transcriptional regulator [Friedmanniella luteola]SDR68965.1 Transcription factor WhiB [Friedmanniella luteola]